MVCMQVAFHKKDGTHENDEGTSDSRSHGSHGNDENHGNPGCKSADCKRGQKKGAARKLSKNILTLFDDF